MDHTNVIFDMHWLMLAVETHRVFAAVMQLADTFDLYTRFL
ncbi:MAG: hypothetical protein VXX79_16175 [Pseudomonadota bacterium]|nr:hypothetical protein [Pseudomonadota bacterium]